VFKAHRLLYHSTLGSSNKEEEKAGAGLGERGLRVSDKKGGRTHSHTLTLTHSHTHTLSPSSSSRTPERGERGLGSGG